MPKEWGKTEPNINKFQKAIPKDATELFEKLKKLAENWGYVDKCGVVSKLKAIVVDLGWLANRADNPDFYIPLKTLEVSKADSLIKALVAKVEQKKPLILKDAEDLFVTIEAE